MVEAVIHCHGVLMTAAEPEETHENHKIFVERTEDEYYVRIEHNMTKNHYKESAYDNARERRELERAAKILFG